MQNVFVTKLNINSCGQIFQISILYVKIEKEAIRFEVIWQMASIIDSFKETFGDNSAVLKIFVFATPVYFCVQGYFEAKGRILEIIDILSFTLIWIFGFLIETTKNIVNEGETLLPSFNIFKMLLSSLKGIIAIGPITFICCFLASYFCSLINIIPWFDITLKTIIWIVATSVIVTTFLMYVPKESFKEAYNIKRLFEKAGDLIAALIFFIIQFIIANIPTFIFIGYALLVLFGFGNIFNIFLAIAIVFDTAVIGQYLGQIYYETMGFDKNAKP